MIKTLKKQADIPHQSLKHVLVVPGSCFSKAIMDKFAAYIKKRSWPFEISYLSQSMYGANSTGNAAETLFNSLIIPQNKVNDSHLDQFFSMTTLNEFIILNDSLISRLLPLARIDLFSSSAIKLEDFGFDIGFFFRIDVQQPRLKFPFKSSVEDVIKHFPVAKKFYPFIKEIRFGLQDFEDKVYRFKVDGDTKKKLVDPRYENIEYDSFDIIFSHNN